MGFGYAVWAMYATGSESIAKGYLLLMFGIPVYVFMKWERSRERITMRTESEQAPPVVPLTKDELDGSVERLRTRTAV